MDARAFTLRTVLKLYTAAAVLTVLALTAPAAEPVRPGQAGDTELSKFSTFLVNNAYMAIRDGKIADARSFITRALETQPNNPRLLEVMAEIMERQEDWPEAEKYLSRLLVFRPDDGDAYARRGFVRLHLGRTDDARLDFEQALSHNPDPDVRVNAEAQLAFLSPPAVSPAGSLRPPEEGTAESARTAAAARLLELAALEEKAEWGAADLRYGDLLEDEPENAYYLSGRGFARMNLGRLAEARADFENALRYTDDTASRRTIEDALGQIRAEESLSQSSERQQRRAALQAKSQWNELERELSAELARDPGNTVLLAERGFARLRAGRYADARGDFQVVLAARPSADMRRNAETALIQIAAEERRQQLEARQREWDGMQARGEWASLEKSLTDALAAEPRSVTMTAARGFARVQLRDFTGAREDFQAALSEDPDAETRRTLEAAVRQTNAEIDLAARQEAADSRVRMQEKITALQEAGDDAALGTYLDELIAADGGNVFALASRGYLRARQERYGEARNDFRKALSGTPDAETRRTLEAALRQADAEIALAALQRAADSRVRMQEKITALQEAGDDGALESYLDEVIAADPGSAFALASRGYLRSRQERFDEAREDFIAAREAEPDSEIAKNADAALDGLERERLARLPQPPGPAEKLQEAAQLIADKEYTAASALLDSLAGTLTAAADTAAYTFYRAEILWAEEQFDAAYPLYEEALPELATEFLQSECLWRMADYNRKTENRELAVHYAHRAARLLPDNEVRNSEVGYLFLAYQMDPEAIYYFERALRTMHPTLEQAGIFMDLGYAYKREGNNQALHYNLHRYINCMTAKIEQQAPNALKKDVESTYDSRREHADLIRRWGLYSGLYTYRRDNGDYAVQQINDLYWQPYFANGRYVQAYVQTIGTVTAKYSGRVFEPLTSTYNEFYDSAHWRETFHTIAGVRVDPFSSLNATFALEKVFKIGRNTANDVRVRAAHSWDTGLEYEPCERSWLYATTFNEAMYSLQHDNLTFVGEARLGRSFRADPVNPRLVVTPYVGPYYGYQGRGISKSERWFAEAGPGLHFRKWYREDKYNAPQSYMDVIVQYRVGLTNKRENILVLNVFHSF